MRQLRGLDTAFLALDGPRSVGHLTLLVVLSEDLAPAQLRSRIAERLGALPVLGRRLVTTPGGMGRPFWTTVPPQLDGHLGEAGLPDHWTSAELARTVLDVVNVPLPRDRPLWRLDLLRTPSGGPAVVAVTVHHAAADGLAFRDVVLALLDDAARPAAPDRATPSGSSTQEGSGRPSLQRWAGLLDLPLAAGAVSLPLAGAVASLPASLVSRARRPGGLRRAPLPGHLGERRTLGLAQVPLAGARALRSSHDATVNDVIMAAATGGLRHHLIRRGDAPDGPLSAVVPVARRETAVDTDHTGGNRLALARCVLPVHETSREERLRLVQESMRAATGTPFAEDSLLDTVSRFAVPGLATPAFRIASGLGVGRLRARPFDLMVSNVPVPRRPGSLVGVPVVAMFPVPLVAESLPLNITAHGYGDTLCYGVTAAPEAIGDAGDLADAVREEHDRLADLAGGAS